MEQTITQRAQHALDAKWYKIDTAGTLYPSIARADWCSAFRMTARMKDAVNAEALQLALDKTMKRFPSMAVKLKAGLFWYYLEQNDSRLLIRPKDGRLCRAFYKKEANGFLLRVLYDASSISVEFFHAITDGTGAMTFLKTLTAEYLRQCGHEIPAEDGIFDVEAIPADAELEDAFQNVPNVKSPLNHESAKAYHFPGEKLPEGVLYGMSCAIPVKALKDVSSALDVTMGAYLTALMLYSGYLAQREERPKHLLPIAVSVPINLRKRLGGMTMRNYSWFVTPKLDPKQGYNFEQIAAEVSVQLKASTEIRSLTADIAPNRNLLRNLGFRLVPLPLKSAAIATVYHYVSDRPVTTTMSNLGVVEMPEEMRTYMDRFEFCLGAPYANTTNSAIVTTGETVMICFTSNQKNPYLPKAVCQLLREHNVPVTICNEKEYQ